MRLEGKDIGCVEIVEEFGDCSMAIERVQAKTVGNKLVLSIEASLEGTAFQTFQSDNYEVSVSMNAVDEIDDDD